MHVTTLHVSKASTSDPSSLKVLSNQRMSTTAVYMQLKILSF